MGKGFVALFLQLCDVNIICLYLFGNKTLTTVFIFVLLCASGTSFLACQDSIAHLSETPEGYDLHHPEIRRLPLELDEISGVEFYPDDSCVFAVMDELGILYKIYLNSEQNVEKWKFGPPDDYEDLVLRDSSFYALTSTGKILKFRFLSADTLDVDEYLLSSDDIKREFETLYYDDSASTIMMICKDCEDDSKKEVSLYAFDPLQEKFHKSTILNTLEIAALEGKDEIKFKPSAAAIHPVTGDLYLLSAINKLLVISSRHGEVRASYSLDPGIFKQPEGLCFMPNGTMIISNEAADIGVANLLIFRYNIQNKP